MNKLLLFCISFTAIFASCNSGDKKDFIKIPVLVDATEVIINKYDNNVQSALDSKRYDYIKTVSRTAMDSSNIKINDLKKLAIPASGEMLRNSAITYIKSLQEIVKTQEMYASITDSTTVDMAKKLDSTFLASIEHAKKMREAYIRELNLLAK